MKGVKINNYIDNRIVLSSRKLKNEVQALIQSNRPRPLVIRHLNYYEQELEPAVNSQEKQTLKAIESKSNKKPKKKSKVQSTNNNQPNHQSNQKLQRKEPVKKLSVNQKNLELKKKSSQSSPSKADQNHLNTTQKRPRSTSKTGEGLGKRSKSAILRRNKSPSHIVVDQDKKKIDEDLKLNLNLKKQGETSKKKKTKKDKKVGSGTNKTKELKKNLSSLNISEKKKKSQKQSETKTSRPPSKSIISSSAQSKPISAREHKKKQTNVVKNLFGPFENKKEEKDHITLEQLLNIQKNDFKVKSAIMKLEDAINSKGSRKKLSEKLELLAEKLKQIDNENQNQNEEQDLSQQSEDENQNVSKNHDYTEKSVQQFLTVEENKVKQKIENQFTNPEIAKKLSPLMESEDSEDEYVEVGEDIFGNQNTKEEQLTKQIDAKRENYIKDADSKRENLERQLGTFSRNDQQQNPLIGRKICGDPYIDLVDYDSINSVKSNQEEKRLEINQLKKFQQESDAMMKRIKKLEEGKKKIQEPAPVVTISLQENLAPIVVKANEPSPRSLEVKNYAFEKYPTIQSARSPKFNSQQIIEVIKLKQKLSTNRHQKLSELVNVMFDKKIVSPKTYSIQMQSLREQQALNNEVLDSYKKHAEQLAQLLSEIKKQKEEISNIDEMIRSQKWTEAMTVIQQNEKVAKIVEVKKVYPPLEKINLSNTKNQQIEDQNEEAVYYSGEDSEQSETGIKLIQIENDQQHKQQIPYHENNSSIKIDESNHKSEKRQRGFESNLFFIKEYCIALCEYVRDNHKNSFRKRIGEPMAYNLQKLLRCFRLNRDGSIPSMANSLCQDLAYHDCSFHYNSEPISLDIFDEFNKQYPSIKYYHKEETQDAALEGIFLKSIYDALNESIMIQKPGSINGKALPWANNSKHLKNLKNSLKNSRQQKLKNQQSQDLIFGISIARIIQWGSCLCGFIPDTVELENTEIDEEYINHIRQTRTALLLQKMLVDQQASMYRTQLEQTEVKICLSQIIFDELAKEIASEMRKIVHRATLRDVDY